jgi:hypothetical protein
MEETAASNRSVAAAPQGGSLEGLPTASNAHATGATINKTKSTPATTLQTALDVRIDVKGAYIEEDEAKLSDDDAEEEAKWSQEEDYQNDSSDIRLPHQQKHVAHMAIDVCFKYILGGHFLILVDWWKSNQIMLLDV